MKTVAQSADISGDQHATPYFNLAEAEARQAWVLKGIEADSSWFAGGLPPDPLAA